MSAVQCSSLNLLPLIKKRIVSKLFYCYDHICLRKNGEIAHCYIIHGRREEVYFVIRFSTHSVHCVNIFSTFDYLISMQFYIEEKKKLINTHISVLNVLISNKEKKLNQWSFPMTYLKFNRKKYHFLSFPTTTISTTDQPFTIPSGESDLAHLWCYIVNSQYSYIKLTE